MRGAAWIVAVLATVAYGAMVLVSTGTAQVFAPVFVVFALGAWGYLTTCHEKERARAPRRRH